MTRCAWDSKEILVDAQRINATDDFFECVFCGKPLFFKGGHPRENQRGLRYYVSPHFFHEREGGECLSDNFVSSKKGEGEHHRAAKREASDVLNETTKIYYSKDGFATKTEFCYEGRRADVALIDKDNAGFLNIEIQTSPIPLPQVTLRTLKDKINGVGETVWAFGDISNRPELINTALQYSSSAQAFEAVVTHERHYKRKDKKTGIVYDEVEDWAWYTKFNQHTSTRIAPVDVTTDVTALMIYDAIKQREELRKNPKFFDMGASSNSSVMSEEAIDRLLREFNISNSDDDNNLYDTKVSSLSIKELESENIQLFCKTPEGIGIATEFDGDKKRVKVALIGKNKKTQKWMKPQEVFVSKKDRDYSIGLKQKRNRKTQEDQDYIDYPQKDQHQGDCSETFEDRFEDYDVRIVEVAKRHEIFIPCNQDIVNTITPIQSDGSEHDLNLKPEPIPNTNTGVTEIKEGDNFAPLRSTPLGVTVDNEANQDGPNRIIENNGANNNLNPKLVSDNLTYSAPKPINNTYNLYDYSSVSVGNKVISKIYKKRGIVTEKKIVEVPGCLFIPMISVEWDDGTTSHPYPHQIIPA